MKLLTTGCGDSFDRFQRGLDISWKEGPLMVASCKEKIYVSKYQLLGGNSRDQLLPSLHASAAAWEYLVGPLYETGC